MEAERGVGYLPGCFRVPLFKAEKHHLTGKPVDLMRAVNAITTPGGLILDPFCGSGATGVAALRDGYRFLGIEVMAEFAATAREWLDADERGLTLPEARAGYLSLSDPALGELALG
jgi:site-specific DNA-methyltransferase (adenine-specific)